MPSVNGKIKLTCQDFETLKRFRGYINLISVPVVWIPIGPDNVLVVAAV